MKTPASSIALSLAALALSSALAHASQRSDDFQLLVRGPGGALGTAVPPPAQAPASPGGFLVAEIAAEADVEFFQACGASVAATVSEIEAILGACSEIFEAGPGITLEVTAILVNTAEPDPYSSSNGQTLLGQFQSNWNVNHAGIERDLTHLFTGKNLNGSLIGLAFLDSICSPNLAYSLSMSKFTADLETQVAVTCQELAHVFGATHCDGQADCGVMCSSFGGCSGVMDAFGASTSAAILKNAQAGGCLEQPARPLLNALLPPTGPAFGAGTATVQGANLGSTIEASFGAASVPFVVLDPFTVEVTVPLAETLGPVDVTLKSPAGSSNSLSYSFQVTSPPGLAAPAETIPGEVFPWAFGADPDDFYVLFYQANDPTTFALGPWTLLGAPTVLEFGFTNAAGTHSGGATAPSLGGVDLRFQVWFIDDVGLGFAGATNIVETLGV